MTFKESLADLRNHVGSRNALILSVAIRGLGENLTPQEVFDSFVRTDCGSPALTEQEINRAITRAKQYITGDSSTNPARYSVAKKRVDKMREGTSPEERGFVKRMINIGREAINESAKFPYGELLVNESPIKISGSPTRHENRFRMAEAFVRSVYGTGCESRIFATDNINSARSSDRVYSPHSIIDWLRRDMYAKDSPYVNNVSTFKPLTLINPNAQYRFPTHICANEVTGENCPTKKDGSESYANKKTIARYHNALIEFDLLDVDTQCLFWYGVIKTNTFDVRSIVWTGGKSLHGIVRLDESNNSLDLFGGVSQEAREQKWDREWQKIMRICCSDDDTSYRCDAACKDPTRMTRFPGGIRMDKDGKSVTEQCLIYCKED